MYGVVVGAVLSCQELESRIMYMKFLKGSDAKWLLGAPAVLVTLIDAPERNKPECNEPRADCFYDDPIEQLKNVFPLTNLQCQALASSFCAAGISPQEVEVDSFEELTEMIYVGAVQKLMEVSRTSNEEIWMRTDLRYEFFKKALDPLFHDEVMADLVKGLPARDKNIVIFELVRIACVDVGWTDSKKELITYFAENIGASPELIPEAGLVYEELGKVYEKGLEIIDE